MGKSFALKHPIPNNNKKKSWSYIESIFRNAFLLKSLHFTNVYTPSVQSRMHLHIRDELMSVTYTERLETFSA